MPDPCRSRRPQDPAVGRRSLYLASASSPTTWLCVPLAKTPPSGDDLPSLARDGLPPREHTAGTSRHRMRPPRRPSASHPHLAPNSASVDGRSCFLSKRRRSPSSHGTLSSTILLATYHSRSAADRKAASAIATGTLACGSSARGRSGCKTCAASVRMLRLGPLKSRFGSNFPIAMLPDLPGYFRICNLKIRCW